MLKPTKVILLLLFLEIVAFSGQRLQAQERERLISSIKSGMRPTLSQPDGSIVPSNLNVIEVIGFTLAGVPVTPGQHFRADDDWLKNLRVKVKNVSGKSISHLHLILGLPEAKYVKDGRDYSMGFALEYIAESKARDGDPKMKIVLPGDEVELIYFEPPHLSLREQIFNQTGVTSITLVQYGGDLKVFFLDGSVWRGSNLPVGTGMTSRN